MSNPVCTRTSLSEANPGFGGMGFTERQFNAAAIYFMVLELASNGGTDYTATMTTDLIEDAQALTGRMDASQKRQALLNILANNAESAGATVPTTLSEINEATACCFQSETVDFESIMLLLLCKLGRHADYPQ